MRPSAPRAIRRARVAVAPVQVRARVLALALGLAMGLAGCGREEVAAPVPGATTSAVTRDRGAIAQRLLDDLGSALRRDDDAALTRLAVDRPAAAALLRGAGANVARLGLEDLTLRYVDEDDSDLDTTELAAYGPDAWLASVEVTYRLPTFDPGPTVMETSMVLVHSGDRAVVATTGGHGRRSPSWLRGPLQVRRAGDALVLGAPGQPVDRLMGLARRAVVEVRRVLPGWRGRLVVEAPQGASELESMLAVPADQYANIAAVTASVDGSRADDAPVHVFLNPRLMSLLGGGPDAQVVLSHEATHVAAGSARHASAGMPQWLLEGFADYVALDHADIPVRRAASQILAEVRADGAPDRLPSAADLAPTATGLGATYEEAWLVCRFLAREHGGRALVAFYRTVEAGRGLDAAFAELGTTRREFVRAWSSDVDRLAQ